MGAGGYELLAQLGRGGMAEVFLARRRGPHAIEHLVVVKRLRDEVRGTPAVAAMFAWEAWISARLCHPNVVKFYDFVSHRGREHLVLEHVRGADLATIVRALGSSGRTFPLRAVVEIGIAAARALEHAHGLEDDDGRHIGLVHRDVSPQNILVSVDGEIKLIDFGVAKTTSAHVPRETTPGLVKGKMGYIAPEHLRGQTLDARGDLYALGVVLFEMATGQRLHRHGADAEMIRATLEAEIPPLTSLRPECPAALEAVLRRALAQDPCDRFESAWAMERALRDVGAELVDDPSAPTLAEIAREVYAAQTSGRSPPSRATPRAEIVASTARPKVVEEVPEEDTRPEGAPRRARVAVKDVEPTLPAAADLTIRDEPGPKGEAIVPRFWSSKLAQLALAFFVGALLAAAVLRGLARRDEPLPARATGAKVGRASTP